MSEQSNNLDYAAVLELKFSAFIKHLDAVLKFVVKGLF